MTVDIHRTLSRSSNSPRGAAMAFVCALAIAIVLGSSPGANAAANPRQDYSIDVTCAAVAAAARAAPEPVPADEAQQAKADKLAQLTLDAAEASGQGLGIATGAVLRAVENERDTLLAALRTPVAAKAASERTELGQTLIRCALVHAIEANQSRPSGQPTP